MSLHALGWAKLLATLDPLKMVEAFSFTKQFKFLLFCTNTAHNVIAIYAYVRKFKKGCMHCTRTRSTRMSMQLQYSTVCLVQSWLDMTYSMVCIHNTTTVGRHLKTTAYYCYRYNNCSANHCIKLFHTDLFVRLTMYGIWCERKYTYNLHGR